MTTMLKIRVVLKRRAVRGPRVSMDDIRAELQEFVQSLIARDQDDNPLINLMGLTELQADGYEKMSSRLFVFLAEGEVARKYQILVGIWRICTWVYENKIVLYHDLPTLNKREFVINSDALWAGLGQLNLTELDRGQWIEALSFCAASDQYRQIAAAILLINHGVMGRPMSRIRLQPKEFLATFIATIKAARDAAVTPPGSSQP